VNKWVADLKKKIDGDEQEDDGDYHTRADYRPPPRTSSQGNVSRQSPYGSQRRSGDLGRDASRYDADPQVLGDDFGGLELRDDDHPPRRTSSRPLANPDLFKPKTSGEYRKVSFQDVADEDIYSSSTGAQPSRGAISPNRQPSPAAGAGGKNSKWEPLSAVDPAPIGDNDPFSLGDSDDEKEKDIKASDTERLKKAAAEAMSDEIGGGAKVKGEGGSGKTLEEAPKTGTKNAEADALATGE
jgi:hypothetical protein